MTYRKCRNPHPTPEGEELFTEAEIKALAAECFGWPKAKVNSWYTKENPRLRKSRPQELVDRGQGQLVVDFLESKREEKYANERRVEERKEKKKNG
jgi:uncharacterized protein (DUF2384 family)